MPVQWFVMDYPPAYIVHGAGRGTGYQDKILDYFASKLPGFRVIRHPASLARLLSNISNGGGVCSGALGKTPEREKNMIFSRPILYSLPIRLVVPAAAAARVRALLDADGKLDLGALRTGGFNQAGVVKGRTYGAVIDAFLAGHRQEASSAGRPELVFRMLARGRVDYSFAYPDEAVYYGRSITGADDDINFETFPIAGMPDALPSYFACSKDETGAMVIAAINKVIAESDHAMPWTKHYLAWVDKNARHDVELAQAARTVGQ